MKYNKINPISFLITDQLIVKVFNKCELFTQNGTQKVLDDIDKEIVQINLWSFIIAWPIYLPGTLAIIGGKEVYHRYLKDRFSIPEDK